MKNKHYLLAVCIGITLFSGSVLQAQPKGVVDTHTIEASQDVGERRDGVLHVSAIQAAKLLTDNSDIKVLDVRTGWEYNRGHLADAVQINYYSLSFKKQLAALDKQVTWLVHCKSGVRSGNTLALMKAAGFTSVIHMDGGIDSWREAKLPVVVEN